jgi:vancomycin resistance protein YoaR
MMISRRLLTYVLASVAAVLVLVGAAYGLDRLGHRNEIMRGVSVRGVDLGGMDEAAAIDQLAAIESDLNAVPITVEVGGQTFTLVGDDVGFRLDLDAAYRSAFELGRQGSALTQMRWWAGHLFGSEEVPITGGVDPESVRQLVAFYEEEALDAPPFDGDIEVDGTTPVAVYPRVGQGINEQTSISRINNALNADSPPATITLDVVDVPPVLSVSDIDTALQQARLLLAGPIQLTRTDPEATVTLTVDQLARALITTVVRQPIPMLDVGFDPEVVDSLLTPVRAEFEAPPKDASLEIDSDDNVTIVPGRPGSLIDATLAAEAAETAARTGTRSAELPFQDGAQPDVTTEDIEALGVVEKLSEFTTFHPCCQARVTNIHLFADIVDGTLVAPGEELSLNELVGQRTSERGFQPAPTIIGGKLEDTVGGGVSQFATTFYNAVFDAGLEDITHKPHSYYFSRYPEGIEATINWPQPDLIFRNDTNAYVLIKTEYTDESITVKFFGDNAGRSVTTRNVSDRYGYTDFTTEYIADPNRDPELGEKVEVSGTRGWSVKVTRIITNADGTTVEQTWVAVYRPQPREVVVHPCLIPEGARGYTGEECPEPETTTTTIVEDSTTTTTEAGG